MKKGNLKKIVRTVQHKVDKNKPHILLGLGITCMITATVSAVKETPKALQLIEERKQEMDTDVLPPVEVVKTAWKPYVPAVVMGGIGIACLFGASSENAKRTAALATAYKLSETALSEYRDAVIETIGETAAEEVKAKVAEKKVEKHQVNPSTVIVAGEGDILYMDGLTGQTFISTQERLKQIENDINHALLNYDYISWNYLLDRLGLVGTDMGDRLGWNIAKGFIEFDFDAVDKTKDGKPCLVLGYNLEPMYDYDR